MSRARGKEDHLVRSMTVIGFKLEVKDSISLKVVQDGCNKIFENGISGTLGFQLNFSGVIIDFSNKIGGSSLVNLLEGAVISSEK